MHFEMLLFVFLLPCAYSFTCPNYKLGVPIFGEHERRVCSENLNQNTLLRALLRKEYVGQSEALHIVETEMRKNILSTDRKQALVLHFSGPTGVGKTYLSKLIAKALFSSETDRGICGLLHLHMSAVLSHVPPNEQLPLLEEYLLGPIVEQLWHCPRSLIVIDDVHFVDIQLLDHMKSAFDVSAQLTATKGRHAFTPVSTRNAIFILGSDLEDKQDIVLKPNIDRSEAIAAIKGLAADRWGRDTGTGAILKNIVIVPFLRLSDFELSKIVEKSFLEFEDVIRAELKQQRLKYSITWDGGVRVKKGTSERILEMTTRDYGARGIENFIRQEAHLVPQLVQQLVELSNAPPTATIHPANSVFREMWPDLFQDEHIISNDVLVRIKPNGALIAEVDIAQRKPTTHSDL